MFNSAKRLRKELSLAQKTPDDQIRLELHNEDNIRKWAVSTRLFFCILGSSYVLLSSTSVAIH